MEKLSYVSRYDAVPGYELTVGEGDQEMSISDGSNKMIILSMWCPYRMESSHFGMYNGSMPCSMMSEEFGSRQNQCKVDMFGDDGLPFI